MFNLYVLQNRQVILTVGAGLLLVLAFFLSYLSMKRPRRLEPYSPEESPVQLTWAEVWSYIPWALILVYVGTLVYGIIDIIWRSGHPPNY
jgi:transposase